MRRDLLHFAASRSLQCLNLLGYRIHLFPQLLQLSLPIVLLGLWSCMERAPAIQPCHFERGSRAIPKHCVNTMTYRIRHRE